MQNNTLLESSTLPIGVFDSGVGGLTVLTELRKLFPHENFVYIGDTKNTPYGDRDPESIIELALRMTDYLNRVPVKMAVIACNTVTVTALDILLDRYEYPIVPVSKGVKTALKTSKNKNIGVMATVMTISSHKHRLEAKSIDKDVHIVEQPCPDLVKTIEGGHVDDHVVRELLEGYVTQFKEKNVDTVILGCTHYPFVKPLLERMMGDDFCFVDSAQETANHVGQVLLRNNFKNRQKRQGKTVLYFTGDTREPKTLANLLMDRNTYEIHQLDI